MQHPSPFDDPEFYENVLVKRAIAFCIDTALIFILCFILLPFTGFLALFVWVPFFAVISFIYRVLTLSYGSATLGMLFLGIEIRDTRSSTRPSHSGSTHSWILSFKPSHTCPADLICHNACHIKGPKYHRFGIGYRY